MVSKFKLEVFPMKVTNQVLLEKINNIHDRINEINTTIKDELTPAIKKNTEFRYKAKGALSILTFTASLIGGALMWIMNKIFK